MSDVDKEVLSKLANNIRRRREQLGFSQKSFAAHALLARTYYGRVERGEQNITLVSLAYIAAHLDASIPELTAGITADVCLGFQPEWTPPRN